MFREISIEAVANGWVARCGCQRFCYTDAHALAHDLEEYLRDPDGKEKAMIAAAQNAKHTLGDLAATRQADDPRVYMGGQRAGGIQTVGYADAGCCTTTDNHTLGGR